MRTAFLSDIHANLTALEAVLSDVARQGVSQVVCLGDIVGYGPQPRECVERVMEEAAHCVLGNHDYYAVFGRTILRGLREDVADGIAVARNLLDERHLEQLRQLPISVRCGEVVCVHASLSDPQAFPYIRTGKDAREHFENQRSPLGVIGHTHIPQLWEHMPSRPRELKVEEGWLELQPETQYLANVGSVGQPRDGDPRACYLIYDDSAQTLLWRRVLYDTQTTAAAMLALGMPEMSAARLAQGV